MIPESKNPSPVFIIGAARSGTKFLRDTLAAAPGFAVVPYDINYIWRRGNEAMEHDELAPESCDQRRLDSIRRGVLKQAKTNGRKPARLVLEKTVSNALRIPFIESVFPDARYIVLVRDGRDVVESSYRCWQAPPDYRYLLQKAKAFPFGDWRYALNFVSGLFYGKSKAGVRRTWGPLYNGIQDDLATCPLEVVVARQWRRCVEVSRQALRAVPAERVAYIRYEQVARDEAWIAPLMAFLGAPESISAVVDHYRATVHKEKAERWLKTFSDDQRRNVWEEIAKTMADLGYT